MKLFCLLGLTVLLYSSAVAFNHPEISWQSVSTRHFIIHYYDKTEPAVYYVSTVAEQVYETISALYNYRFESKINISLADYDDYSNGWASWTDRNIMIWIPDMRFDLRGNTIWLRNVLIHELAHIISMEKRGSPQFLQWNFSFTFESPQNTIVLDEPFATSMFYPSWFVEGAAQLEAQNHGADCWDSRRDMVLRCAIIDKSILTLDEMAHFNHDGFRNELVYNQGYSFVNHIRNNIPQHTYSSLWKAGRAITVWPPSFETLINSYTKKTLEWWYENWRDSLSDVYRKMQPSATTPTTLIWGHGWYNALPRISPDRQYWGWLTNNKDDYHRTDLVIAKFGTKEIIQRIRWASYCWDFSADGTKVYYISSQKPTQTGSFFNNLYVADIRNGEKKQLTRHGRVYDFAAAADGRTLICVRYYKGVFSLELFDLLSGQFTVIEKGLATQPFTSISINPDYASTTAAIARIVDGISELYVVDLQNGSLTKLELGDAHKESPFWAADGRIYFSADYDGIFNIYSVKPDGSDLTRHSSVLGGLFSPYKYDENQILCSEYCSDGFKIVSFADQKQPYQIQDKRRCSFTPLPPYPKEVIIKNKKYRSKLLRPVWALNGTIMVLDTTTQKNTEFLPSLTDSRFVKIFGGGATVFYNDALEKKTLSLSLQGFAMSLDDNFSFRLNASEPIDYGQSSATKCFDKCIIGKPALQKYGINKWLNKEFSCQLSKTWFSDRLHSQLKNKVLSGKGDTVRGFSPLMLLLLPSFNYENRWEKPTLGVSSSSILLYVLPLTLSVMPYGVWRLGAHTYFLINPLFLLTLGQSAYQMPFNLLWSRAGYITEDIHYTMRDVAATQIGVGIADIPTPIFSSQSDSSYGRARAVFTQASLSYGLPLPGLSSMLFQTILHGEKYNESIKDPFGQLDNMISDIYITTETSISLNFPIVRKINRGFYYADALYGSVWYRFWGISSKLPNDADIAKALYRQNFDPEFIRVSHEAGVSILMGVTKSYLFSKMLQLKLGWDIWEQKYSFSLSF